MEREREKGGGWQYGGLGSWPYMAMVVSCILVVIDGSRCVMTDASVFRGKRARGENNRQTGSLAINARQP